MFMLVNFFVGEYHKSITAHIAWIVAHNERSFQQTPQRHMRNVLCHAHVPIPWNSSNKTHHTCAMKCHSQRNIPISIISRSFQNPLKIQKLLQENKLKKIVWHTGCAYLARPCWCDCSTSDIMESKLSPISCPTLIETHSYTGSCTIQLHTFGTEISPSHVGHVVCFLYGFWSFHAVDNSFACLVEVVWHTTIVFVSVTSRRDVTIIVFHIFNTPWCYSFVES